MDIFIIEENKIFTLIVRTSSAVAFATSLADCTKRRRATWSVVFDDASREILHKADVFLAIVVAKVKILIKKDSYRLFVYNIVQVLK